MASPNNSKPRTNSRLDSLPPDLRAVPDKLMAKKFPPPKSKITSTRNKPLAQAIKPRNYGKSYMDDYTYMMKQRIMEQYYNNVNQTQYQQINQAELQPITFDTLKYDVGLAMGTNNGTSSRLQ